MKDIVKDYSIDWMAYTVKWPYDEIVQEDTTYRVYGGRNTRGWLNNDYEAEDIALFCAIPGNLITELGLYIDHFAKDNPRMSNYDMVYKVKARTGEIICEIGYHSKLPSQGIHVIFRGNYLTALRMLNIDISVMLAEAVEKGAKLTRLDIALDITTMLKPKAIYQRLHTTIKSNLPGHETKIPKGKIGVPAHTVSYIENDFGLTGSGCMVGAWASARVFRIYDKGAQMGNAGQWLRIEAQLRDSTARAWADSIVDDGLGVALKTLFLSYFTGWERLEKWLENLKQTDPPKLEIERRTASERWLKTVAVPAVLEAMKRVDVYGAYLRAELMLVVSGVPV